MNTHWRKICNDKVAATALSLLIRLSHYGFFAEFLEGGFMVKCAICGLSEKAGLHVRDISQTFVATSVVSHDFKPEPTSEEKLFTLLEKIIVKLENIDRTVENINKCLLER